MEILLYRYKDRKTFVNGCVWLYGKMLAPVFGHMEIIAPKESVLAILFMFVCRGDFMDYEQNPLTLLL